jgi:hypothetical protein
VCENVVILAISLSQSRDWTRLPSSSSLLLFPQPPFLASAIHRKPISSCTALLPDRTPSRPQLLPTSVSPSYPFSSSGDSPLHPRAPHFSSIHPFREHTIACCCLGLFGNKLTLQSACGTGIGFSCWEIRDVVYPCRATERQGGGVMGVEPISCLLMLPQTPFGLRGHQPLYNKERNTHAAMEPHSKQSTAQLQQRL